jgi:hypothetical protein
LVPVNNASFRPRDPETVKQNKNEMAERRHRPAKDRLALAELEAFTGALLAVLLALLGSGVAGEEAFSF